MNTVIRHQDVPIFFERIMRKFEVIAPRRGDPTVFAPVQRFADIEFNKQTDFSAKRYFLPCREELMSYRGGKSELRIQAKERVMVLHPCDANAILNHDRIFLDDHPDPYYKARREATILIVFQCVEPFEGCFCTSMGADETVAYDLLFVDIGDKYVVRAGSAKGKQLMDPRLFHSVIREGRVQLVCNRKVVLEKLANSFDSKAWQEESDRCLSCMGCIMVCPSCFCFTIEDSPSLDPSSGTRARRWDYCYSKEHTQVAGGYVFRSERWKRFRHRIYHQLKFHKDKYGRHLCVGCGRCVAVCPTGIDMVKIVNSL